VVNDAITAADRAAAVEAISCVVAGNKVFAASNRVRTPGRIAEIIDLVAAEIDADVKLSIRANGVG
jgi:hypothetical protein